MYDDILGEQDEKDKNKEPKKFKLSEVCYDCGNIFEDCECEEGFGLGDVDLDEEESKLAIDDNEKDSCDGECEECAACDDPWSVGIEPSQDIGCIKFNDMGRNCSDQCITCELHDCLYTGGGTITKESMRPKPSGYSIGRPTITKNTMVMI
jgi:hypothetical protein